MLNTNDFETEKLNIANFQGNAVINYTEAEIPYTRIIEHKHFEFGSQPTTIITREYPATWKQGDEPAKVQTDKPGCYNLMAREYQYNGKDASTVNQIETSSSAVIHLINKPLSYKKPKE